jgi:hypothetical protein
VQKGAKVYALTAEAPAFTSMQTSNSNKVRHFAIAPATLRRARLASTDPFRYPRFDRYDAVSFVWGRYEATRFHRGIG